MRGLKSFIRCIVHKTVLRPPYIRYCSQTIYESLLGCLRMWEATGADIWKERADEILEILLKIQQPDGGWDIGYDFNFGLLHKKGQSTSPELVGLVALAEYAKLFGKDKVFGAARIASDWIRRNAMDMENDNYAIPYSPYSCRNVMVYNGTSFAVGALGRYLGFVQDDEELRKIYEGMCSYMESVLSTSSDLPGRFWYYNDQSRDDMNALQRHKIDYYHQMQQVEMHSLAQQAVPVNCQLKLISDAADQIAALQNKHKVIPYYNKKFSDDSHVHSWGLASVIPGILEAAVVLPTHKETYQAVAKRVLEWLLKYAWNGEYFIAVLDSGGSAILEDYMVRSDAWVFSALAAAQKHLGAGPWSAIAEQCFCRMEAADFSGPENHASRCLGRLILSVYAMCRGRLKAEN